MKKDLKYYKEKYIMVHNLYLITKKKNILLLEERERHNKLIDEQGEYIKRIEKRLHEYEKENSKS